MQYAQICSADWVMLTSYVRVLWLSERTFGHKQIYIYIHNKIIWLLLNGWFEGAYWLSWHSSKQLVVDVHKYLTNPHHTDVIHDTEINAKKYIFEIPKGRNHPWRPMLHCLLRSISKKTNPPCYSCSNAKRRLIDSYNNQWLKPQRSQPRI